MLSQILPEDLVKFGLIPELVGRIPVITGLKALDEEALIRILVEPKNAIVKQYQKLFEMDNIQLIFEPEALKAIAIWPLNRKTAPGDCVPLWNPFYQRPCLPPRPMVRSRR